MDSPSFHKLKKQASFFLKEKIKTARLALTDVTPTELLTEEATDEDSWPPDTHTMGLISRSAFEVDDYWRIVDILHKRLWKFDEENWRGSYKALVVLEHLLTHGPQRVSEEFQCDKEVIKEMERCRFNWGLRVREKSERILKLLDEDRSFLKQERSRARKLTSGIKGFGSFTQKNVGRRLTESRSLTCFKSDYNDDHQDEDEEDDNLDYTDHPFRVDGHQDTDPLT
ncbi:ENTH/VHS-like protein [Cynara cardunculus var. scolymus]|uniref:ENTH/VHS-like protein n=1 Tax=Cynara cardunculus var. scolymus TaxID=59895 RepID=A0A103YD77_CYNCS|nr:ENTH/VHS-like protein [Cynara cardunculus var. scolymus]